MTPFTSTRRGRTGALAGLALVGLTAGYVAVARADAATTPAAGAAAAVEPAPTPTATLDGELSYKNREGTVRRVPYRVWYPVGAEGELPAILVSHGGKGNETGYTTFTHLGAEYAGHGYLSIHIGHLPATSGDQLNLDRPDDVKNVLDAIEAGTLSLPTGVEVDTDRIGHAGHSWGAYTAHAVGGAVFEQGTFTDKRIKAIVPMSPQGFDQFGSFDEQHDITKPSSSNSWMSVTIPAYDIVGEKERDREVRDLRPRARGWRLFPYARYPEQGDKFLSVLPGQDHEDIANGGSPEVKAFIAQNTRVFFDVYLKGDAKRVCDIGNRAFYPGTDNRRKALPGRPVLSCPPPPAAPAPAATSPAAGTSRLSRLTFHTDYTPGATDPASGQRMGGTEVMHLVGHENALYAAVGNWKDDASLITSPGAQILVKDSPTAAWRVDRAFPGALRVSDLKSVTIETDRTGRKLPAPLRLLVASAQDVTAPFDARIYWRDDATGTWGQAPLALGLEKREFAYARTILEHRDAVTGIDHVFAGVATSALYRGAWDAQAKQLRFEPRPELVGTERMHSGAEANGRLFVTVGTNGNPADGDGGLFVRTDGPDGASPDRVAGGAERWRLVYEWPPDAKGRKGPGLRGLTVLPGPAGDELLGAREAAATIDRIEPEEPTVSVDLDFRSYLTAQWGGLGGGATLAAYNDMLPVTDPDTGRPVHLIGLFVNHPDGPGTPLGNSAWYLVRQAGGTYELGRVVDTGAPMPAAPGLRAVRSIVASPFATERGTVFYFGGFDAGGPGAKHDTAWIYRAELPPR